MRKVIISAVAATAMLFTSLDARPAFADERTERLIVGAVLLGIIAAGISESNRRGERGAQQVAPSVPPRQITPLSPGYQIQPQSDRYALPSQCLQRFDSRQGNLRLFSAHCLEQHYTYTRNLPLACAVTIQRHGRFESGFHPQCLRDAGYRLAGR